MCEECERVYARADLRAENEGDDYDPWKIVPDVNGGFLLIDENDKGRPFAKIPRVRCTWAAHREARLLCAAPQLAMACLLMQTAFRDDPGTDQDKQMAMAYLRRALRNSEPTDLPRTK